MEQATAIVSYSSAFFFLLFAFLWSKMGCDILGISISVLKHPSRSFSGETNMKRIFLKSAKHKQMPISCRIRFNCNNCLIVVIFVHTRRNHLHSSEKKGWYCTRTDRTEPHYYSGNEVYMWIIWRKINMLHLVKYDIWWYSLLLCIPHDFFLMNFTMFKWNWIEFFYCLVSYM